jgi:hypothetical protein
MKRLWEEINAGPLISVRTAVAAELRKCLKALRYSAYATGEATGYYTEFGTLRECPCVAPADLPGLERLIDGVELAAAEAEDAGPAESWPDWTDEGQWVPVDVPMGTPTRRSSESEWRRRRPPLYARPGQGAPSRVTDADVLVMTGCAG